MAAPEPSVDRQRRPALWFGRRFYIDVESSTPIWRNLSIVLSALVPLILYGKSLAVSHFSTNQALAILANTSAADAVRLLVVQMSPTLLALIFTTLAMYLAYAFVVVSSRALRALLFMVEIGEITLAVYTFTSIHAAGSRPLLGGFIGLVAVGWLYALLFGTGDPDQEPASNALRSGVTTVQEERIWWYQQAGLAGIIVIIAGGLSTATFSSQMWLPQERLTLTDGQLIDGYVLRDSSDYYVILPERDRRLREYKATEIADRAFLF
jgi:hypothetical protein